MRCVRLNTPATNFEFSLCERSYSFLSLFPILHGTKFNRRNIFKRINTKKHYNQHQVRDWWHSFSLHRAIKVWLRVKVSGRTTSYNRTTVFLSSECASKLFRTCFEINKFHCGQAKCRPIATNVFAPYSRKVLKNDLAKRHYITVSTDASNHSNIKMMPVVVRYFVPTVGAKVKILEFSSEKAESSEIITSLITRAAEKNQITDKIVGFCGGNCPTNFGNSVRGSQNNVYYRLKQWNPSLIGVGCSAHIVHNAIKHACLLLPVNIENMVVSIFSHFYYTLIRSALKRWSRYASWLELSTHSCWGMQKAVRATSIRGTQTLSTESPTVFHGTSLKTVATVCQRTVQRLIHYDEQ